MKMVETPAIEMDPHEVGNLRGILGANASFLTNTRHTLAIGLPWVFHLIPKINQLRGGHKFVRICRVQGSAGTGSSRL